MTIIHDPATPDLAHITTRELARLADQHATESGGHLLHRALRQTLIALRTAREGDPATWPVDPSDWAYAEAERLIDNARRQRERAEQGIPTEGATVTRGGYPGTWTVTGHEDGRLWIRAADQSDPGGTFLDHLVNQAAPEVLVNPADLTPAQHARSDA